MVYKYLYYIFFIDHNIITQTLKTLIYISKNRKEKIFKRYVAYMVLYSMLERQEC